MEDTKTSGTFYVVERNSYKDMKSACIESGGEMASIHSIKDNQAASQVCLDAATPNQIALCYIGAKTDGDDDDDDDDCTAQYERLFCMGSTLYHGECGDSCGSDCSVTELPEQYSCDSENYYYSDEDGVEHTQSLSFTDADGCYYNDCDDDDYCDADNCGLYSTGNSDTSWCDGDESCDRYECNTGSTCDSDQSCDGGVPSENVRVFRNY